MKRNLFWLFLFFSSFLWGDNVTISQAEQLARNFFGGRSTTRSAETGLEYVWNGEDVQTRTNIAPAFYVFNRTSEGGFIIIAGDDAVTPVLAYSYTEKFEVENMPPSLRNWMGYYREQINWAKEQDIAPSKTIIALWDQLQRGTLSDDTEGEVLLSTALWNQDAPYNKLCPNIDNVIAPTGCVATALAITMKYNRWPDQGSGATCTYTTRTYQRTLSVTYDKVYAWDDMPDVYLEGSYTAAQANAVGRLMYHCGVLSQMNYTPQESGAYTPIAARGMVDYMKYDKSLAVLEREWYTNDEWDEILKKELNAGRLVIYGGSNAKQEGHQFVFDGYRADRYHVNWGWGGTANGYYSLSALDPDSQGVGGNTGGGFTVGQDAVIGVKKSEEGSGYCDNLAFMSGFTESGEMFSGLTTTETTFIPQVRFTVKAGFYINYGIRNFSGAIVLALVDKHGNIKEFITREVSVNGLKIGYGSGNVFSCSIANIPEEGDRIWMMYKSQDGNEWKRVRGDRDTITEIIVKELSVSVVENADFSDVNLIAVTNDMTKTIYIKSPIPILEFSLVDIKGRIIKKTEGLESVDYTLSYSDCIGGTYIVQVVTSAGMSSTKVIIK